MKKESIFEKIIESFASRTFMAIFGIIGTAITIYAFLQENKANLRYEIIANTNVLDFNADISKLEVKYDSTNLKLTGENLRIYTIKVVNSGKQIITNDYYDQNELIGIKLSNGKIIEKPVLIQASSDYIKRQLKIIEYQKDEIKFSSVILENGEFYIIKLLVLHKTSSIPNITSFGKIAGQKNIDVVNAIDVKDESSTISKVFLGNLWVQILKLIIYFFIGLGIIFLVMYFSDKLDNYKKTKKRKKIVSEFKLQKTYQYTKMDDTIFDMYIKHGSHSFKLTKKLLIDEVKLNSRYNKLLKENIEIYDTDILNYRYLNDIDGIETIGLAPIIKMINEGFIIKENDFLHINYSMKATLELFTVFLKEKKEYYEHAPIQYPNFESIEELNKNEIISDE